MSLYNELRDMAILNRKLNSGKTANDSAVKNMKQARARTASRNHGKNGSTILNVEDVVKIKKRLMDGESVNKIARECNVSFACISQINVGKNWKDVVVPSGNNYVKSKQY